MNIKPMAAAFLFLLILSTGAHTLGKKGRTSEYNLLLITLDTTRADVIGLYNRNSLATPNLDRIGREGIYFTHCYSNVPLTLPAHSSLFTGRYPHVHQVRNNGTYSLAPGETTLAEIFRARGLSTAAVIASFTVCAKFGLSQGFDSYDEDFDSESVVQNFHTEIDAGRVYQKFERWIENHDGRNFFSWIHFYDPHFPYILHEGDSPGEGQSQWPRYESEVRYMDSYIGKIVDQLDAEGLLENTVIVIVGDHGEAFGEHGEFGHGIFCYEESLRVPLIIYNPQLFKEKRVIENRVSLVDIFPTLLELFKLDIPGNIQGESFLGLLRGKNEKKTRTVYFESLFAQEENNWAPSFGLIDGDHKYISLPMPELYDLKNDGGEIANLFSGKRKIAGDMRSKLENILAFPVGNSDGSRRKPTQADLRKLEALGYVSSFSNRSNQMIDPKQGISVYSRIKEINNILAQKNTRLAEQRLNEIISENSGLELPAVYQIRYQIEKSKGDFIRAVEYLREAVALFPDHEALKFSLAGELFDAGHYPEAEEFCRQLIEANNRLASAYFLLGNVYRKMDQLEKAEKNFDEAIQIEPQNTMMKVNYALFLLNNEKAEKSLSIVRGLGDKGEFAKTSTYLELISKLSGASLSVGDFQSAVPFLKKISEIDPENPEAWVNLGSAYFGLDRLDSALECYQKALSVSAKFALAHSNIGLVMLKKHQLNQDPLMLEKSLESFNLALRYSPGLGEAYHGRAMAFLTAGEVRDAIKDFAMAIELNPELIDAYFNLAGVFVQEGNYSEAFKYLNLCKDRFYRMLSLQDRSELDRMINEVRANIKFNKAA